MKVANQICMISCVLVILIGVPGCGSFPVATPHQGQVEPDPESFIEFRSNYDYQLASDYSIRTNIKPQKEVDQKFIKLDMNVLIHFQCFENRNFKTIRSNRF